MVANVDVKQVPRLIDFLFFQLKASVRPLLCRGRGANDPVTMAILRFTAKAEVLPVYVQVCLGQTKTDPAECDGLVLQGAPDKRRNARRPPNSPDCDQSTGRPVAKRPS
ncbi:hypothetical protein AOLI_G00030920 [Acnodon oligacanthus]